MISIRQFSNHTKFIHVARPMQLLARVLQEAIPRSARRDGKVLTHTIIPGVELSRPLQLGEFDKPPGLILTDATGTAKVLKVACTYKVNLCDQLRTWPKFTCVCHPAKTI